MDKAQYFAQRLLNPFRGMLHTIAYASAEAVTTDGVHWDIYVRNDELVKDLENSRRVQTSDIRYGSWSEEKGLKRGAVFPSEDFRRMEDMGAVVYGHLLDTHQQLPFALQDHYELWLLVTAGLPLGLLDSVVFAHDMDLQQTIDWRAGLAWRESFSTDVLRAISSAVDTTGSAGEYLTQYINKLADEKPSAQWFHRQDGGGLGLHGINMPAAWYGRRLPAEDFPVYLLRARGHDANHEALLQAFFQWQAPWLLLLSDVDREQRRELERRARTQALVVDRQFRLYPEVIDEAFIKAARVEAMLRKRRHPEINQDDVMSTFYIELHPSPTE